MKTNLFLFTLILALYNPADGQGQQQVVPAIERLSKYQNARDFTLSPSGSEAYFTLLSPLEEVSILVRIQKENGQWSQPDLVEFSGKYRDLEPFMAPDGLRLYFASNRPLNDSTDLPKDFDLWYVERRDENSSWSAAINLGSPVNTEFNEFYPSVSSKNNLYFTGDAPGFKGKDDIFFSRWNGKQYTSPVSLTDSINTEGYEFNAFISPDESFLIFSGYNREDGLGSGDLYISFRYEDGTWSTSQNLKNINSKSMDYCPFVDMDSKTMYFTSKRSSIDKKKFSSVDDFLNEINRYANGSSRIYKVSVESIIN